jgi:hypothetical protein
MTKQQAIIRLIRLLAPHNLPEQARLKAYHSTRPLQSVLETLSRQMAIANVTATECARHCQPYPLYSR